MHNVNDNSCVWQALPEFFCIYFFLFVWFSAYCRRATNKNIFRLSKGGKNPARIELRGMVGLCGEEKVLSESIKVDLATNNDCEKQFLLVHLDKQSSLHILK